MTIRWTRRQLLSSIPVWLISNRFAAQVSAAPKSASCFVVISGVSPSISVATLTAFLAPFVRQVIPVTVSLDPEQWKGHSQADKDALREFLSRLRRDYSGLVEMAIHAPGIAESSPYFQARLGLEARNDLKAQLGGPVDDLEILTRSTTVTDTLAPMAGRLAVRTSGFRNLLCLPDSESKHESGYPDSQTLKATGGHGFLIPTSESQVKSELSGRGQEPGNFIVHIRFESGAEMTQEIAMRQGSIVAEALAELSSADGVLAALPSDFHLQDRTGYKSLFAVLLDDTGLAPEEASTLFSDFASDLARFSIPISLLLDEIAGFEKRCPTFLNLSSSTVQRPIAREDTLSFSSGDCAPRSGNSIQEEFLQSAKELGGSTGVVGLDSAAVHQLGWVYRYDEATDSAKFFANLSALRDNIIIIGPDFAKQKDRIEEFAVSLWKVADTAGGHIVPLDQFAKAVELEDSLFDRFKRERNLRQATKADQPTELTTEERARYMADAALAFGFLQSYRREKTGMAPATVFRSGTNEFVFDEITMWDIGSQLLGLKAAADLNLLSAEDYTTWAAQIIDGLPEVEISKLILPCSVISSTTGEALTKNFNACDLGRLASALYVTQTANPELAKLISGKFDRWMIGETIRNSAIHDITNGRFTPFVDSHCVDYSVRALKMFSFEIHSPYSLGQNAESLADRRMSLLHAASSIGILGAEPLLLDAIELGGSEQLDYLTDVLFTEQVHSFAQDGHMVGVSETPLNRAPWFSYQGLNLRGGSARWNTQSFGRSQSVSSAIGAEEMIVSPKAAFLWDALRPHAYSRKLLSFARERGRFAGLGFAAGVLSKSDRPAERLTDVNTNSIVLQAIAHKLRPLQ